MNEAIVFLKWLCKDWHLSYILVFFFSLTYTLHGSSFHAMYMFTLSFSDYLMFGLLLELAIRKPHVFLK